MNPFRDSLQVYIVRNKIDQAISCNQEDYEIAPDVTVQMVMAEMVGYGCPPDRTFCMTAKSAGQAVRLSVSAAAKQPSRATRRATRSRRT